MIYFTSDMHLFHENSIKYDARPFRDLDHMHQEIIYRWNSIVQPTDVVYNLGDCGFPKGPNAVAGMRSIITQLNGFKVTLRGNHDKSYETLRAYGFQAALHGFCIEIAGELVTASHYPLAGVLREDTSNMRNATKGDNWHGETKYAKFTVRNRGQFHLHGHTHCSKLNGKPVRTDQQFDVGMPGNNYTPVSIKTIESWIAIEKQKRNK